MWDKEKKQLAKLFRQRPGKGTKRRHRKKRNKKKNGQKFNEELESNTVVNISNVPLSPSEIQLLSRGLSFCPKPSKIDQFQLRKMSSISSGGLD